MKDKASLTLLLFGLFALASGSSKPPPRPKGKDSESKRQQRVLNTLQWARPAAQKYGVPLPIVLAVLDVESWGWPRATSPVGAKGYMQLMPDTAKIYLPLGASPYDPEYNINGGVHLLSDLYKDFPGDWYAVFTAYNAGPGYLRLKKDGTYTKRYRTVYVNEVLSRLEKYKNIK